jgi:hypothetical protein
MSKSEREARLEHVKVLGRIEYRILSSCEIFGVLTFDDKEKRLWKFDDHGLDMELIKPFRANAAPTEFSAIKISAGSRKVFEIRWGRAGNFKVVFYEPGDWERTLLDWPDPIPF